MNLQNYIYDILRKRHLLKRRVKHYAWQINGNIFAEELSNDPSYSYIWTHVTCPVVNHSSQAHLVEAKVDNMKKAAGILTNLIIKPKEIFSFWRLIGKPTSKRGFLSGPTFEGGKIIQSTGGGLCQVSGLIYNLALESGMTIIERYPHSVDAYGERRYLPLARDATVAWISKDLCFQNNTESNIQLRIQAYNDRAEGQVYSTRKIPYQVTINQEHHDYDEYIEAKIWRVIQYPDGIKTSELFPWNRYRKLK